VTDPTAPTPEPKPIARRQVKIAKPPASAKPRATRPAAAKLPAAAKPGAIRPAGTAMSSKRLIGLPARETPVPFDGGHESLEIARRIVEIAEDKKAADIVLLDIGSLTTLADAFVVCSGGSERQLDAIADGILEGLRAEGVRPIGREGVAASHWVLLDFGGVIVHIFTPPERDFYQLEKHWSEARTVLQVQ
jgi:ribosome-associated protein